MSEKEQRRLHECWEKPEFQRMFNEYAEEVTRDLALACRNRAKLIRIHPPALVPRGALQVSDPKHRAETEAYLTQCEAEARGAKQARRPHAKYPLRRREPARAPRRCRGPAEVVRARGRLLS